MDPRSIPYTNFIIMLLNRPWVEKFEAGQDIFPPKERKPGPRREITPEMKAKVQEMFSGIGRKRHGR